MRRERESIEKKEGKEEKRILKKNGEVKRQANYCMYSIWNELSYIFKITNS